MVLKLNYDDERLSKLTHRVDSLELKLQTKLLERTEEQLKNTEEKLLQSEEQLKYTEEKLELLLTRTNLTSEDLNSLEVKTMQFREDCLIEEY